MAFLANCHAVFISYFLQDVQANPSTPQITLFQKNENWPLIFPSLACCVNVQDWNQKNGDYTSKKSRTSMMMMAWQHISTLVWFFFVKKLHTVTKVVLQKGLPLIRVQFDNSTTPTETSQCRLLQTTETPQHQLGSESDHKDNV